MVLDPLVVTLAVTAGALVLFLTEALRVEVTALLVAVTLMVTGVLTPAEGLSGLSDPAVVIVLSMFILAKGIERTGLLNALARWLLALAGGRPRRSYALLLLLVAVLSTVMNNTPVVALGIPLALTVADRSGWSPSTALMPVSFVAMLAGTTTLVGTSSNLVAASVARDLGVASPGLLTFAPVGVAILLVGFAYLVLLGPRIVPRRRSATDLPERFGLAGYLFELEVLPDSPLEGKAVARSDLRYRYNVEVVEVFREGAATPGPVQDEVLRAGDVLLVRGHPDQLAEVREAAGVQLLAGDTAAALAEIDGGELFEATVAPGPHVEGATLRRSNLRRRFGAEVLAARRGPEIYRRRLRDLRLRHGDVLLVLGDANAREAMMRSREFILSEPVEVEPYRRESTVPALVIFGAVLGVAVAGWFPLAVSALAGVVLMLLTGCVRTYELHDAVDWKVIVVLAGILPLGVALRTSGAAALVASAITSYSGGLPPVVALALVYGITVLLAQVISNVASVVLMVPVAVEVAEHLGATPLAFVLATAYAASAGFLTPIGYQTNLMVYGPGEFRFADFLRVGLPLAVLVGLVTMVLLPWVVPL